MKRIKKLMIAAVLLPQFAFAHNIEINTALPAIKVVEHGEITLKGEEIEYQPWDTAQLLGKTRVLQMIAGRSSAKALNEELMAAITKENFSPQAYQTTTVINQDDAIWGTARFVKSSAEDSKKEFSWSSMVLDANGLAAKSWGLTPESSTIVVQNAEGHVLFVKEGKLSSTEVSDVIDLIKSTLK